MTKNDGEGEFEVYHRIGIFVVDWAMEICASLKRHV